MKAEFERMKPSLDTAKLQEELTEINKQADKIADEMDKSIELNSRLDLNQSEFNSEYSKLEKKYLTLKKRIDETTGEINKRTIRKKRTEEFFKMLDSLECEVTEFDEKLIVTLVDKIMVYAKDDIRVTFINGAEITV